MANKKFVAKNGIAVGTGHTTTDIIDQDGHITANTVTISGTLLNATAFAGTANNASYLEGSNGSYYTGYADNKAANAYSNAIAYSANATNISSGTLTANVLPTSGVTAATYGNSSSIPVITIDATGRITSATTNAVAGVTGFTYTPSNATFIITTGAGSTFPASISSANDSVAGIVKVLDSVSNTDIYIAASANSVKTAYDNAATAYSNAATYADNKAANAYSNATSYAASIAGTAYSNATTFASSAAATAYTNAASYADTKAATSYSNATSYADVVAGTAYTNATSYAASIAGTAYSNATTFASSAAATAYSNAVSAASSSAATAYSNATTFAANATNISSGTLAELRLPFRMDQNVRTNDTVSFGNMTITGNLTVTGTTVTVNANNLSIQDNMIYLNSNSAVTNPDLGIAGNYNDGTYRHAGFFRDASDGVWKVFDQYLPEPDASPYIDTANASFRIANFQANVVTAASFSGNGASVTSVDAATVGGNTAGTLRSYSDSTAATAYSNATSYAATIAGTAYTNATSFASSAAATAYSNAVSAASSSAATAYSNSVSYAASIAGTAYSNATSYAATIAGTAYSNAVSYFTTNSAIGIKYDLNINVDLNGTGTTNALTSFNAYFPSGGGYNQPVGGGQHFRILQFGRYNSSDSNYWRGQIAQSFYEDRMWFRKEYSQTWGSWQEFWHTGNDGSGSGLDADLWDGYQFADYLNQAVKNTSAPSFYKVRISDSGTSYFSGLQNGALYLGSINNNYKYTSGWSGSMQGGILADCADNWEFVVHDANDALASAFCYNGGGSGRNFEIGRDLGWGTMYTTLHQSARSPIFYDSNNTAYFLEPGGDSSVQAAVLNGNVRINPRSESWAEGISFNMPSQAVWGGIRWVRSYSGSGGNWALGYLGVESNNDMAWWSGDSSVKWRLDHSGNQTVSGSSRAPIFYDSANTSFYVDPGSTSTSLNIAGGITTTAAGGSILLKHAVSEVDAWIFQENASNWGLYWKNAPSGNHTFGGYTSVGAELVGMSAGNASGNGVATTNFVGATSAIAQWMISNYTGYIWSASTIYAAGSMSVGGSTVWHAGNDGSGTGLDADLLDGFQLSGTSSVADKIFNNKGNLHGTYTDFNTVMQPGPNYIQQNGNGPGSSGSHQWYGFMFGLGSEYGTSTGSSGHYASQLYYGRVATGSNQYLWARDMESGAWGSWRKLYAGLADGLVGYSGTYWTSANDGSGSGLDADTLDGNDSGRFYVVNDEYNAYISSDGWYTIAEYGSGRAQAVFHVFDTDSSRHNYVRFSVTWSFGNGGIEVLSRGRHGTSTIRHVRLLYNTSDVTYGGVKVQIYCENAAWTLRVRQETIGISGWGSFSQVTPTLANSVASFAEYSRAWYVNDNGTFSISGNAGYMAGNAIWHAGNDGSGSGLDADLLDGYNLSSSASGSTVALRDGSARLYTHLGEVNKNSDWVASFQATPVSGYTWHGDISTGGPTGTWWFYESMRHSNSGNYWGTQIAWGWEDNANQLYQRNVTGNSFSGWVKYWNSGNDGSGSGLDADLLDGISSGSFTRNDTSQTLGNIWYFQSNQNHGGSNPPLQAYSSNASGAIMAFHRGGYYAVNFGLDSDNVMRIGGWSASSNRWQLDMSGNMTAAGNITAYSDIRLKKDIQVIENAIEKVKQIRGVTFTRTDEGSAGMKQTGVIAQEVELVLPEVVFEDNNGVKNVAYGNMVGLLIEAIKEQQKQIEELKAALLNK